MLLDTALFLEEKFNAAIEELDFFEAYLGEVTRLDATFEEINEFEIDFSSEQNFNVDFGELTIIGCDGEEYKESYFVTPAVSEKYLYTKDKVMKQNVIVRKIPCETVSNVAGGYTVTIGGEI